MDIYFSMTGFMSLVGDDSMFHYMDPRWTGKPGKIGKHFPVSPKYWKSEGILPKMLEKIREFYPKYWKVREFYPRILEKWEHFSQFLFLLFLRFLIEVYI